jgi:general secretion pathway protein G
MSRGFKISVVLVVVAFVCGIFIMPRLPSERKAHAHNVIDAVQVGLSSFQHNHDRYPTTAEGLIALVERPPTIPAATWHGPYTYLAPDELLTDPWGHKFVYRCPGVHNSDGYDVYSLGPNGKGGNEAIGNWTTPPNANQ